MANVMDSATDEGRVAISSLAPALSGYASAATSTGAEKLNGKVWSVRYHTKKVGESLAKGNDWSVAYHTGALLRLTEGW
jgi:hypothetical protein